MSDTKCPHCEKEIDTTDWIECWSHDGDDWNEECPHCEEFFNVCARIEIIYDTSTTLRYGC